MTTKTLANAIYDSFENFTPGEMKANQLFKEIDSHKEVAASLITQHTVYMEEAIFAGLYLPYIVGEKTEELPRRLEDGSVIYIPWTNLWLGHCKSFGTKVTVYDPKTKKILFDVPPLQYFQGVRRKPKYHDNANDVRTYYALKGSSRGGEEEHLQNKVMESLSEYLAENEQTLTPELRDRMSAVWEYIINKYTGITIGLKTNKVESDTVVSEPTTPQEEEMEFEEFDSF